MQTSIKLITIKKIGKDLACMLSPTIISGDVSKYSTKYITTKENNERNNGIMYSFFFMMNFQMPQKGASKLIIYFNNPIAFKAGPNSPTINLICLAQGPDGCGDVLSNPEFAKYA